MLPDYGMKQANPVGRASVKPLAKMMTESQTLAVKVGVNGLRLEGCTDCPQLVMTNTVPALASRESGVPPW